MQPEIHVRPTLFEGQPRRVRLTGGELLPADGARIRKDAHVRFLLHLGAIERVIEPRQPMPVPLPEVSETED